MACGGNDQVTYTAGVPQDVKAMRQGLISALQMNLKTGATPYNGPVAAGTNPLSLQSANILSNLMSGQGYYGGTPIYGSGSGGNGTVTDGGHVYGGNGGGGGSVDIGGGTGGGGSNVQGPNDGTPDNRGTGPGKKPGDNPYDTGYSTIQSLLPFLMSQYKR
jgi:hypothetical protein